MFMCRINVLKKSIHPNLIYRFSAILIKTPASYLVNIDKLILKFVWEDRIATQY